VAASGGGLLKGVGRWLDRGINRLIGVDSGAASAASSDDEFDASAPTHRRRATADVARIALVGFHLFPSYVSKTTGFELTQWRLGAVWTPSHSTALEDFVAAAAQIPLSAKSLATLSQQRASQLRQPVGLLQQSWSRQPE